MAKVKNVLKGLLQEYELEEISIISSDCVVFSGTPGQWKATDVDMILYKKQVEDSEIIKKMIFNNRKAFIFI